MKKKSKTVFQSWFSHNAEAAFIIDNQGHFIEANDQTFRQFNISKKQLFKLSFLDLFIWPDMEAYMKKVKKEHHFPFEGIYQINNKDNKPVEINISSVSYEDRNVMLCISREIIFRPRPDRVTEKTKIDTLMQQRAELDTKEYYSIMQSIINNTDTIIFSVDRYYNYTSFNNRHASVMKQIYGREPEIGISILDIMSVKEDRETAKVNLDQALAGKQLVKESYSGEEKLSRRYFRISHSPVKIETGEVVGAVVIAQDITELKKVEETLRESEERYRLIAENTADTIAVLDLNYNFIYISPSVEKFRGYTAEETMTQSWDEIFTPSSLQKINQLIADQMTENENGENDFTNIEPIELEEYCKDGSTIWVEIVVSATRDKVFRPTGIIAVIRDITKRKQAEEELCKIHEELKRILRFDEALLSAVPAPVFYKDKEGRYLGCNRAFSEFMGVTPDQIKGKTVFELWPEKHAKVYHSKDLELMKNPARQIYEFKVRDKDGLERQVIYSKDVFRDENNQVAGIVGSFMDITERKQAEEILQRAHVEMEKQIEQRTADLKRANEKLTALYKVGQAITSPLNLQQVLDLIAHNTAKLLGSDTGVILLIDDSGKFLTIQGAYGLRKTVVNGTRDRIGESIAGRVVQNGKPIVANDLPNDKRFYNPSAENEGLLACASVPMTVGGKIIGTLDIHSKTDRQAFSDEHIYILEMLASQAAIAIENARLYENIKQTRDELEVMVQQRTSELVAANDKLKEGIVELKRAKAALWESTQMLKLVLNNMPAFVFWKDRNSVFLGCNNLFASNAGLDSPEDIVGKTDLDLPWKDTEAVSYRADDRLVIETGHPKLNYEETQLTADGRNTWVKTSKVPLRNMKGNVIGILGTFEDITERKRAELLQNAVFQISQATNKATNLNELFKSVHEIICTVMSAKNFYISLYDEIKDMLSFPYFVDEVDVHKPQSVKPGKGLTEYVLRTGKPLLCDEATDIELHQQGEVEIVGSPSAIWIGAPLVFENKTIGVIAVQHYTDPKAYCNRELQILEYVSSQIARAIVYKRAEEKLQTLSRAIEQSPVSIVITDTDANIEYVNPAFTQLTGYILEEALGRNPRILKSNEKRPEEYKELWDTITSGKEWRGEFYNKKKNGEFFWESASISPIFDSSGIITHYLGVKEDITMRKKYEAELIKAKEKAEESNRLKSAFLATMNHELRTPLNHILGFTDLMRSGALLENIADYADIIHKSSHDLLEIIESIFELALAEQSEIKLRLQTFKCLDLFISNKSVMNEILEISGKKDQIELVFNADKELLLKYITTDKNKINQVLINLFKNAVKFTNSGKIEFGLISEEPGWLTFYVKDTGIGIPANKHDIIFEFFRQADDSHTREYGGVGIGLAISKKIAEVMNGIISLDSTPGKGSKFYFKIPALITSLFISPRSHEDQKITIPDMKGKTILIAEDDPLSINLIKRFLSDTGVRIIEAINGKEVIEKLNNSPDIILMDLNMPVMDGYTAAKIIKSRKPEIPIIAISTYALSTEKNKALEAGCNKIISKPIDQMILLGELIKHLLPE